MNSLQELKARVIALDEKAEDGLLPPAEQKEKIESDLKIFELEKALVMDLKQRARIKWAIDGDENSKIFHGMINHRRRRNMVQGICVNGLWISDPMTVKSTALEYWITFLRYLLFLRITDPPL